MTSKTEEYSQRLLTVKNVFARRCPNGTWRHHKGGVYLVLGFAIDRATKAVAVRHRRVDGEDFNPVAESYIEFTTLASEFSDRELWTPVSPVLKTEYVEMTNGQY